MDEESRQIVKERLSELSKRNLALKLRDDISRLHSELEKKYRELDTLCGIPDPETRNMSTEDLIGLKISTYDREFDIYNYIDSRRNDAPEK